MDTGPSELVDGFWIRTEPTIDGKAFIVTLSIDQDYAVTLTPTRAMGYATALLGAAAEAEYDAAILKQVTTRLGLDDAHAVQLVNDMRADRPPRRGAGLIFEGGVSRRLRHPFITILRDGTPIGQMDTPAARRHALHVLEAPAAADLDALYLKVLRSTVMLEEDVARTVVNDIENHRASWAVSDR